MTFGPQELEIWGFEGFLILGIFSGRVVWCHTLSRTMNREICDTSQWILLWRRYVISLIFSTRFRNFWAQGPVIWCKYSNFSPLPSVWHQTATVWHQTEILVYKKPSNPQISSPCGPKFTKLFPHAIGDHIEVPWKFQFDTCCLRGDLGWHNFKAAMVYPCFCL